MPPPRPSSTPFLRARASGVFWYHGMREDALGLTHDPARATTKRREPPPAVLDFHEPAEVEQLAQAAAAGLHRTVTRRVIEPLGATARAAEDAQDAKDAKL